MWRFPERSRLLSLTVAGRVFVAAVFLYVAISAVLSSSFFEAVSEGVDDIQTRQIPAVLSQNRNALKMEKLASLTRSALLATDPQMGRRIQLQTQALAQSFTLDGDEELSAGARKIADGVRRIVAHHAKMRGQRFSLDNQVMIREEQDARRIYEQAIVTADTLTRTLSNDAALRADTISNGIREQTATIRRAWFFMLTMPAFGALFLFFAYQRHVVRPINATIERLRAIGTPVFDGSPQRPPLLSDLRMIGKAVETYGHVSEELRRTNDALLVLSDQDPLTKVGNRRLFDTRLTASFAEARATGKGLALLLIDLDHFKRINDGFGHQAGDRCLETVADVLRAVATSPDCTVARYGGEEFAVIMPGAQTDEAARLGEALRHEIETRPARLQGLQGPIHLTASIGVATLLDSRAETPWALIEAADAALYTAKMAGRNRVCIHAHASGTTGRLPRKSV